MVLFLGFSLFFLFVSWVSMVFLWVFSRGFSLEFIWEFLFFFYFFWL